MSSSRWCAINGGMVRTGETTEVGRKELIRVVLADDHAEFRLGLKEMLATDGGIEVVGEAENGARAVALVGEVRPDVVVLDLVMPVMEGTEALGLILRAHGDGGQHLPRQERLPGRTHRRGEGGKFASHAVRVPWRGAAGILV
jgi:hypothetical protein